MHLTTLKKYSSLTEFLARYLEVPGSIPGKIDIFATFVAACLFSQSLKISIKSCIKWSTFYAQPQNFS